MTLSSRSPALKIFWVLLMLAILVLNISGFQPRFEQLLIPAVGSTTQTGQLSTADAQALVKAGLSTSFYATYFTVLEFAGSMVFWVLGAILLWRRPHERMAVIFAWALILFTPSSTPYLTGLAAESAAAEIIVRFIQPIGWTLLLAAMFTFPTGHFVPRWMRWAFAIWLASVIVSLIEPSLRFQASLVWNTPREALLIVWACSWLLTAACVQFYRYKYVASSIERMQTKWVVYGLGINIGFSFIGLIPTLLFPLLGYPLSIILAVRLFTFSVVLITMIIWAVTIAIALMRYRLFDIDLIIRRTVQYTAVSAVLIATYYGSVVLLQTIFANVAGKQSQLVIVVSTLLTAALFNPLRTRLQTFIDGRFYRRKYNAEQILAHFAQTARDEVELDELSTTLLNVVQETMQPNHINIWLKPTEKKPS